MTDEMKEQAAALYAAGESVNGVAKQLGIGWSAAKKLQGGGDSKPVKKPAARVSAEPAEETEEVEPENFDVAITVPTARLVDVFTAFSAQEKACSIAYVLQQRMDAVLGAE